MNILPHNIALVRESNAMAVMKTHDGSQPNDHVNTTPTNNINNTGAGLGLLSRVILNPMNAMPTVTANDNMTGSHTSYPVGMSAGGAGRVVSRKGLALST